MDTRKKTDIQAKLLIGIGLFVAPATSSAVLLKMVYSRYGLMIEGSFKSLRRSFEMMKLTTLGLGGLVVLSSGAMAMSVEEETSLGLAAGEYYAAVVMNEEFKMSKCAAYLKIPTFWHDSSYAMQDIQWNIPDNVRGKAKAIQAMPNQVASLRLELKKDFSELNDKHCQVMAKRIYNITMPPIMKWNDLK